MIPVARLRQCAGMWLDGAPLSGGPGASASENGWLLFARANQASSSSYACCAREASSSPMPRSHRAERESPVHLPIRSGLRRSGVPPRCQVDRQASPRPRARKVARGLDFEGGATLPADFVTPDTLVVHPRDAVKVALCLSGGYLRPLRGRRQAPSADGASPTSLALSALRSVCGYLGSSKRRQSRSRNEKGPR